jgi:hypothetical protein
MNLKDKIEKNTKMIRIRKGEPTSRGIKRLLRKLTAMITIIVE